MPIGLVRHLVVQKVKMKIVALASRLGVLEKKESEEGGRKGEGGREQEGPVRRIVTLPLQLSLLRGHHPYRNSTSTPSSGPHREY